MLKISFFIIINCLGICAFAQNQNVYFLKENGKRVNTRDSADYIRIVSEPDSGSNLYNIKEYYIDGKLRLIGKTSKIETNVLEGQCLRFYPNGKKKTVSNYQYGKVLGEAYEYYPNGRLYSVLEPSENGFVNLEGITFKIKTLRDSLGRTSVINDNGYYINYQTDFQKIAEEGKLKNGFRDSIWKGSVVLGDSIVSFNEIYINRNLIAGSSQNTAGTIYKYTKREVTPEFKGGGDAYGKYLSKNLLYPLSAKRENREGRVFIQFIVERDGSLSEFKVLRDPGYGLGEEALRVIKRSPKWSPGRLYGRPVRVQFTVPVNFSLN